MTPDPVALRAARLLYNFVHILHEKAMQSPTQTVVVTAQPLAAALRDAEQIVGGTHAF